jgi:predicted Zn-dependent peptidase
MDQALQVLVDILQNPVFDEGEVLAERGLQLADIRSLQDDDAGFATSLFMRTLFGDHAYGRTALGTEAGIGRLTGTSLREWFRNNQRKILPAIIIVGDTRGTSLVAPIADALTNEDLESRDILTMPRATTTTGPAEPTVETANRHQTTLVYGFAGVNQSSSDRYVLDILARFLSGRNASYARGGAFFTTTSISPDKEADVRAAIDAEFARIRKDGLATAEFSTAVQYTLGARQSHLQSRESRMLDYAREIYAGVSLASIARYDTAVKSVTLEQVRSAIGKHLAPGALRIGVVRSRTQ